jgi:hypothetical protein
MKIDGVTFDNVIISSCPHGEVLFDTPGTFSWVAPAGVTSISAVVIGPGATNAGGGGGLTWVNGVSVTPGTSYTVEVGAGGYTGSGTTNFSRIAGVCLARGGTSGGGSGGAGGTLSEILGAASGYGGGYGGGWGGGAGGYAGNGGVGYGNGNSVNPGTDGAGGGGGGGGNQTFPNNGGGGGTGVYGQGSNGVYPGGGGSGGGTSSSGGTASVSGRYGGGGVYGGSGVGAGGAVRIIWGTGRSFPSTNVGQVVDYGFGLPNPVNALSVRSLQASYDPQDPASFPGTTTFNDVSGNGWNGTFAVSPTRDSFATVTYNGSTQIATIPDSTSQLGAYNSTTGLSFVVWIKASSLAAIQYIFDKRNTGNTAGVSLLVLTNGTIQAQNAGNAYSVSTTALITGTWYNIVLTISTTQTVSYYINNSSAQNGGSAGSISSSVTPLKIGATANNSSLFNGQIGQFAIYNITLTATDVDYIYKTTKWRYGL